MKTSLASILCLLASLAVSLPAKAEIPGADLDTFEKQVLPLLNK